MPTFTVTVSGEEVRPGNDDTDNKFGSEEVIEGANISDALLQAISRSGLDGFSAGHFIIEVQEGDQVRETPETQPDQPEPEQPQPDEGDNGEESQPAE